MADAILIIGLGFTALLLTVGSIIFLLWWYGIIFASKPAVTTAPPTSAPSATTKSTSGSAPSATTASTTMTPAPTGTCTGATGIYQWQGTPSTFNNVGIQTISQGTTLTQCSGIKSPDGNHIAVVQSDGNVVVYNTNNGNALWATNTANVPSLPVKFVYQTDGNLVLYDSTNKALWASGTNGKPSDAVAMQNDGNFVLGVFNSTPNSFPWATATNGK